MGIIYQTPPHRLHLDERIWNRGMESAMKVIKSGIENLQPLGDTTMAKVIKEGTGHQGKDVQHTCKRCHSVIEFNTTEGRPESDRNEQLLVYRCPVCGDEIWTKL